MNNKNQRLTASEISVIWSSYINNTFSTCILKYFLRNVEDTKIKHVLQLAFKISENNVKKCKEILELDDQSIPVGFTDHDVSPSAPRLYSDAFYLYYLKNMSKVGLSVYGVALCTSANKDVRDLLSKAIQESTDLYNKTAEVLLSEGIYIRPPYVTTSNQKSFINSKGYLSGLMHTHHRPINVLEITHIEANIEANSVGRALLAGFSQVAKSKKVRDYCTRGKEISKKHIKVFAGMLTEDDLPAPMPWDVEVTDSTIAPFSDKLIMFHISLLIASSISNYATAAAASLRTDISADYIRLSGENAKYAKDGLDIMIKNNWLEEPPQIPDHEGLAKD
ncbi:DUF3231 family protein [Aquibacillus koreensis]|uniref:DUF3231 family protein n=1 Tax=Aquibacillus koreensis TaxID=279446 RepID=A0A9X4AK04_9BACI|nr:DUF3231 family protein [Aquibacillus koreensis]MCT2537698.1 DUF3231 family protein [Aquibacillus koreensis]MDC3420955.1 DUF3231 family protein [Aquibacillus koreensis]